METTTASRASPNGAGSGRSLGETRQRFGDWCGARSMPGNPSPSRWSANPPVARFAPLVRNREDGRSLPAYFMEDRVRKMAKDVVPEPVLVLRPHRRVGFEKVDRVEHLGSERVGCNRASLEVPEECASNLCLCLRQDFDDEANHRALSHALASDQGTALTIPARNAVRRSLGSCRQASEIAESSLPSKLSSSATTSAERSSVGRPRDSSSRWSTRAFIAQSPGLASRLPTARARR